jgi:repressor LexA
VQKPLTERQRRVLELIAERIELDGVPPSLAEIGRALGGVSPTAALAHVVALERKGYLRRDRHLPRSLRLIGPAAPGQGPELYQLPIAGAIAAGSPIEAFEGHVEHVWVETGMAGGPGSYVLRVRGNSMIGDGILDGDLVVVQPAEDAEQGATVVALLADGSATLKRLYRERGYVRLQPANDQLEPIVVPSVRIQGRVVAVLRRLLR